VAIEKKKKEEVTYTV